MPHYKRMFDDKEHLYAFDLDGREVTVQIEKCFAGELQGEKGRKSKKPIIKIVGKEKRLALNKTNGKTIATLYGTDTDDWAGKWITIYPTTTDFGGETVECIRVRPNVPQGKSAGKNGNGKRPAPTGDQIDRAFKEQGLIDETDKERVDRVEREFASETTRRKATAERAIGRELGGNDQLTDAEKRAIEAAEAAEGES